MKHELLELTRRLRRRAQLSHEADFAGVVRPPARGARDEEGRHARGDDARGAGLAALAEEVAACRLCPLGASRLRPVFGVGSPQAQVMFVGEGPGFEEDHRGEPFVGRSGQLLDKIMESIGLSRATVYIANIVKCHPMKNPDDPEARANDRPPTPAEIDACRRYLDEQIRVIRPRVIVTLGAVAARVLLDDQRPITAIRGQWRSYEPQGGPAVKLLPTFHPAALLRNPNLKKDVWADMKNLRAELTVARAEKP